MSAPPLLRIEFPARAESLAEVRAAVQRALATQHIDARIAARIVLAIDEACANIIRHATARRITLKASIDDRLTLEIADDGRGMPPGSEQRTGSHGLKQMRFRMEAVGGTLRISPNDLGGTSVQLSVPLEGSG